MDDLLSCEICTMRVWTPVLYVCLTSLCPNLINAS